MKRILVTGADGFIGSHLTEALVRAGHEVRAFVLYNSFNSWGWLDHCGADVKGHFEVFAGDVRDPNWRCGVPSQIELRWSLFSGGPPFLKLAILKQECSA